MSMRPAPTVPPAVAAAVPEGTPAWRRRKEQRRPEIIDAARALIEDEGASDVSMARIAGAAGVSEATVYNYFANKQDLVNQVLRQWAQPFIDRLTAELSPLTELRPRLVLIAIRYLRSMEQTPKLHRVFYTEIRWADYRGSEIHRLNNRFVQSIIDTIRDGIASGEIEATTDPAMFRDMLFGGLEHIAQRTLFADRPLDVEREAGRYIDLMLKGATPRGDGRDMPAELARLSALIDRLERGQNG